MTTATPDNTQTAAPEATATPAPDYQQTIQDLTRTLEDVTTKYSKFSNVSDEEWNEFTNFKKQPKAPAKQPPADKEKLRSELELEIRTQFQKDVEERDGMINQLRSEIDSTYIEVKALSAIAPKFLEPAFELLKPEIVKQLKLDPEKKEIIVVDAEGKSRFSNKDKSKKMTVDELAEELAVKYAFAAKPQGKNLNTATPNTPRSNSSNQGDFSGIDEEKFRTDPNYRSTIPIQTRTAYIKHRDSRATR